MLSSWLRFSAMIILILALCNQSGIVSAALDMGAPPDFCCPAETNSPPESDDCCAQPECQCPSCLSIGLQDSPFALAGSDRAGQSYHNDVSPLSGGVYRTIDYPPEFA